MVSEWPDWLFCYWIWSRLTDLSLKFGWLGLRFDLFLTDLCLKFDWFELEIWLILAWILSDLCLKLVHYDLKLDVFAWTLTVSSWNLTVFAENLTILSWNCTLFYPEILLSQLSVKLNFKFSWKSGWYVIFFVVGNWEKKTPKFKLAKNSSQYSCLLSILLLSQFPVHLHVVYCALLILWLGILQLYYMYVNMALGLDNCVFIWKKITFCCKNGCNQSFSTMHVWIAASKAYKLPNKKGWSWHWYPIRITYSQ